MTVPCRHTHTGEVQSTGSWGKNALAPVCDDQKCIDAATKWVERMTGKPAKHVRDGEKP